MDDRSRYARLAPMMAVLRADKRYRIAEESNRTPSLGRDSLLTVTVWGPVDPEDIERRLPAPSDLNFRRWGAKLVTIGDPDADPAVRPMMDVSVHFLPPRRLLDGKTPASFFREWDEPIVTPGIGLPSETSDR
jgi:hypothetical protein